MTPSRLVVVGIRFAEILDYSHARAAASTLGSSQPASLRFLDIEWLDGARGFDLSLFVPLSSYIHLEEVTIVVRGGVIGASDDSIDVMVASWRALQRFIIQHVASAGGSKPSVSLGSLQSFAEHCPKLMELTIAVDAHLLDPSNSTIVLAGKTEFGSFFVWRCRLLGYILQGHLPSATLLESV